MSETELKTQAECEAAGGTWNEAKQTCTLPHENELKTDADLMRENERLKSEVEYRKDQVQILLRRLDKRQSADQAREDAELERLISNIVVDSNGKWKHDELKQKTKDQLNAIREDQTKTLDRTFASIAAIDAEEHRRKEPLFTVGAWDSRKKQWVGGT